MWECSFAAPGKYGNSGGESTFACKSCTIRDAFHTILPPACHESATISCSPCNFSVPVVAAERRGGARRRPDVLGREPVQPASHYFLKPPRHYGWRGSAPLS